MKVCIFTLFVAAVFAAFSLPSSLPGDVQRIIQDAQSNPTRGWDRLALWVDSIGPRICGSAALEKGLDFALNLMKNEGFDNVHAESATIPSWNRGNERLTLLAPFKKNLNLLGLGTSIGTAGTTITADVVVVETFEELQTANVTGKIVVYNQQCDWAKKPTDCYGITAKFRVNGASEAAKYGAVASLTRSLTGFSLYTPHTGVQEYAGGMQIPAACITVEDAEMFSRMQKRGTQITVSLYMEAVNLPNVVSRNIIAEIRGSQFPDQVVMFGGHTDSWDVGQGAEDDGAGFMVSFEALSMINRLVQAGQIQRPLRTIRLIGWVCEEFGGIGAQQYFDYHKAESVNMSLVMESDLGIFTPKGLLLTASPAATQIMTQIMALAGPLNATAVTGNGGGEDSGPWINAGVPGAAPYNDNKDYFLFHHTNADMMTHVPVDTFEPSAAVWAIAAYGAAMLTDLLPR